MIAKTTAALTRLKPAWIDKGICPSSKIRLMRSLVTSIFLYDCESWTLTAELQRRNTSHGNEILPQDTTHLIQRPCYQRGSVRAKIQHAIGVWTTRRPPDIVKRRKLQWYGHVSRSSGLAKTILQGTVKGPQRSSR